MTTLLLAALNAAILLVYIKAMKHNIMCLKNCNTAIPVNKRFSSMRQKEWLIAAPLGSFLAIIPLYFPVRMIYYLQELSFGTELYVSYNYKFNAGLFLSIWSMSYPLFYIVRTVIMKRLLGSEYDEYCTSYNVQIMNGGKIYLPDKPVEFHKELLHTDQFLIWAGVALATFSLILGSLGMNEYAYFRDDAFYYHEFGFAKTEVYHSDDFEKIYLVDSFITFTGYENESDYYAFEFKDGNRIAFRTYAKPSEEFIRYASDFSGLPITKVHVLDNRRKR